MKFVVEMFFWPISLPETDSPVVMHAVDRVQALRQGPARI